MLRFLAAADIVGGRGTLAVTVFGDGQHVRVRLRDLGADDPVAVLEADAAHADGLAAHGAHVRLGKADGLTVVGRQEDVPAAVGAHDVDELVALVERECADAARADVAQSRERHALDRTAARGKDEERIVVHLAHVQHGVDMLVLLHLDEVDDVHAARGAPGLRDEVALLAVAAAAVGKEEDVVMRRGGEHGVHIVLVAQRRRAHALAAALLRGVLVDGHALDVAAVRERKHALLLLDEVFDINVVLDVLDLRFALVAVLIADGNELVAQHGLDLFGVGQQLAEVGDTLFQLVILVLQLLALEPLQGLEAHIENGLRLHIGQAEALHKVFLRVVIALADDADDLVDVLLGDEQTLEQMRALERFLEVELRAAHDDLFLEGEVLVENVPQGQDLRLRLVIDQREHVHGERGLHLRLGEEPVEHDLGVGVLF